MSDDIRPRDLRFGVSADPRRRWLMGNLAATAAFDCFSMMLPEGERFFIRSLKHYEPKLHDAELKRQIREFSAQEAFHSREHGDYNRGLASLGFDADGVGEQVAAKLGSVRTPISRLAVTCAIEHVTTSFALMLMAKPEMMDDAPAHYRRLWFWHALEEAEHAAVALDVFNAVTAKWSAGKRYAFRVAVLTHTLAFLLGTTLRAMWDYAKAEGETNRIRFMAKVAWTFMARPGLLSPRQIWRFLAYYRPGFDPARVHDPALLERWRRRVDDAASAA